MYKKYLGNVNPIFSSPIILDTTALKIDSANYYGGVWDDVFVNPLYIPSGWFARVVITRRRECNYYDSLNQWDTTGWFSKETYYDTSGAIIQTSYCTDFPGNEEIFLSTPKYFTGKGFPLGRGESFMNVSGYPMDGRSKIYYW